MFKNNLVSDSSMSTYVVENPSQRKEKEVRKGRVSVGNRDCRAARWSKDTKGSADDHLLIWASHPTPTWPVTPDKDSPPPLDCPCPHFLPCFLLGHLAALQDTDDTRFSEDVELPLKDGQSKQESGLLHIRSKFVGGEAQDGRQQQWGSMEGSSVVQEGQ